MPEITEVLRDALALSANDRAHVAESLLASLDELDEQESERLWAEEAQRRLDGYRNGSVKGEAVLGDYNFDRSSY